MFTFRQLGKNDKLIVGVAVALILIAGVGYAMKSGSLSGKITYVADVTEEIDLLEAEITDAVADLEEGLLTPEKADFVRASITSRVESITERIVTAEKSEISPEMKSALRTALTRLTTVLTTYRDSLRKLDTLANKVEPSKRAGQLKIHSGSGGKRSLAGLISDAIEALSEHIDVDIDEELLEDDEDMESQTEEVDEETSGGESTLTPTQNMPVPDAEGDVDEMVVEDEAIEEAETGTTTPEEVEEDSATSTEEMNEEETGTSTASSTPE